MGAIDQIVKKYLSNVRPSGSDNFRATCPLCDSKRAFVMSGRTGLWTCYSCEQGGSLRSFLYKMGLSRDLIDAQTSSVVQDRLPDRIRIRQQLQEDWHVLPEWVLCAYDQCPTGMLNLGFSMDLLQDHDVGYDRHEDRITFAIRDYLGRLTGVSGRACENWRIPRYKVYQEPFEPVCAGYVPTNRKHLYGFHDVYPKRYFESEGAEDPLIIVEGYKGCLWMRQLGFSDVVAIQGSLATPDQLRLLDRIRGPKFVLLDCEPGKALPGADNKWHGAKIVERLSRSGRAFLCKYPEGTEEGTSPDDLDEDQAKWVLNNATTISKIRLPMRAKWSRR